MIGAFISSLPRAAKIAGGIVLGLGAAYGAKKLYDRGTRSGQGATKRKPAKKKKKVTAAKKRKLTKVKKAADKLRKAPTKKNIKEAIIAAKNAGLNVPASVVTAAEKL